MISPEISFSRFLADDGRPSTRPVMLSQWSLLVLLLVMVVPAMVRARAQPEMRMLADPFFSRATHNTYLPFSFEIIALSLPQSFAMVGRALPAIAARNNAVSRFTTPFAFVAHYANCVCEACAPSVVKMSTAACACLLCAAGATCADCKACAGASSAGCGCPLCASGTGCSDCPACSKGESAVYCNSCE